MPEEIKSQDGSEPKVDSPYIEITIDKKGNMIVETLGTTGNQCDLLSGKLEESLGKVTERKNKEHYNNGQK